MDSQNRDEIFQKIKSILDEDNLRSKERKSLIDYYKLIKDDPYYINELKRHDPYYWLRSLEVAYAFCTNVYTERQDREIERHTIMIKGKTLDKVFEDMDIYFLGFRNAMNSDFFSRIKGRANVRTNMEALKRLIRNKRWFAFFIRLFLLAGFVFGVFFVSGQLMRLTGIEHHRLFTGETLLPSLFVAIICSGSALAFIHLLEAKKIIPRLIAKIPSKPEKAYQKDIKGFTNSYSYLCQKEKIFIYRYPGYSRHLSTKESSLPIEDLLTRELMPENISLLLPDGEQGQFSIIASVGLGEDLTKNVSFNHNSPLIHLLKNKNELLVKDDLPKILPQLQPEEIRRIKDEMELIKAEICVPIHKMGRKGRELIGILCLGPKLYGRYTGCDLENISRLVHPLEKALTKRELSQLREFLKMKKIRLQAEQKLEKDLLIEEAEKIVRGEDEKIWKSRPIRTWYIFDGEVHKDGVTSSTRESMKRNYDIEVPEGYRIDHLLHGPRTELYGKAILDELGIWKDKERVDQLIKEKVTLWLRHQTEWFDGTGFPDGLAGEKIPLMSRVTAVAEAFDIFYQLWKDAQKTLELIKKFSGKRLDPSVVEALEKACQKDKIPKGGDAGWTSNRE